MTQVNWDKHERADLEALILKGKTSYEIADELNRSRSAICNAARRFGLSIGIAKPRIVIPNICDLHRFQEPLERLGGGERIPTKRGRKMLKAKRGAANQVVALERHSCRYGFGDPKKNDFRFCGEPITDTDCAYCDEHKKVVYKQPDPD